MAHEYRATIRWQHDGGDFAAQRYSRKHVWRFDGVEVPGSSAPSSVPLPYSAADAVDPEEALVAATSSCHMLFFLYLAAKQGFIVQSYEDDAVGVMTKNANGKLFMSRITLRPAIAFSGDKQPIASDIDALHHRAHDDCYIANSILAEVVIEARTPVSA